VGWVDPRIGLGWVGPGMGRKFVFLVGWVGLGHGSEMAHVRKIHVVLNQLNLFVGGCVQA